MSRSLHTDPYPLRAARRPPARYGVRRIELRQRAGRPVETGIRVAGYAPPDQPLRLDLGGLRRP